MAAAKQPRWETVAIVGVGLIGGSIGRGMANRRLARRIVGIGRRASSLEVAQRMGAVSETTTNIAQGVKEADLVVVCTPVGQIADQVTEVIAACPPHAVITDAGSTKAEIVAKIELVREGDVEQDGQGCATGPAFVGSHPLAGSHASGPQHAEGDLLVDRTVVVTPTARTVSRAVTTVTQFWQALGARVVEMTPQAHDQAVALTSHVPHVIAAALASNTPESVSSLVASGWLDTTRIASGEVSLWEPILWENRDHILKGLEKFGTVLDSIQIALAEGDRQEVSHLLQAGKDRRDALGN